MSTWRRHRKLLNPTFSQRIVDGYLEVFNENVAQFVTKMEKELGKEEFDIFPYLADLTLENILQTAFGLKTLQTCNDEYKDAVAKILEIYCSRFRNVLLHQLFIYNWTKTKEEENKYVKILKKASSDMLRARKAELNENLSKETKKSGCSVKGFLDHLLELQSEGLLTDKEITEEVDTMIIAGSDTTARSLLFVIMLLASHPDAQDRVYTEIQEVLAESCSNVSKNHLSKLIYMEAVIKESLRLYSIAPVIGRKVIRDSKHVDFVLPSDSVIVVMLSGINRNDYWGKDVDNFNPDRWLDGSLPDFATFSFGSRSCLGLWEYFQSVQDNTINGRGIMKVWMGPKLFFVVTDPKIAQTMLNTFEEKPYIYEFAKSWVDTGLVTSDVSTWRRHRKLLTPTFNQRILHGFLENFNALSSQLVTKIEKEIGQGEFDIFPYLIDFSLESVFQSIFGLETRRMCSDEYKDAAAQILDIMCTRLQNVFMHPSFLYNWTKTKKEEEKCVKILKNMSSDVLRTRKAEINKNISKETISSDDFVLPSGSIITVWLTAINRNDFWGQDVETFNPDRWLNGSFPDFASFSFRRRSCLGWNYAMMLMKTTLVHFLLRYRVSRKEMQLKLKYDLMLKPVTGHNISVESRQ